MANTQCRKWQITINNPIDKGWSHDKIKIALSDFKDLDYWCLCDEIGNKEHTLHTHIFLYRKTAIRFSKVKKTFPEAHLEAAQGTCEENRAYIRKEGKYENSNKAETNLKDTFEEFGECPKEEQDTLYDMIKDGYTTFEILEENPNYMKRMNDIDRVREAIRYEQFKNVVRQVHVEYWWGHSGAGKTSGIYALYDNDYSKVYRVTDYRNPWDGYKGQDVVLFEEFHSDVEIGKMLVWLDIYPLDLPCRYNNKTACYTKVYITSNESLYQQYKYIQKEAPETWNAFERRIHCIKEFGHDGKIAQNGLAIDKDGFLIPDQNIQQILPF